MSAPVAPPVLAGDREREQTANQLGQALAQGYFALDEYETRLQATFAAHTTAELRELVADLPLDRIRRNDPARGRLAERRPGAECRSISRPTWRWSSSCSPYGWSSASPRAPGTSGRSGRSSARASESSAMRCRSGSRCPLDARRVRVRSGRRGSRSAQQHSRRSISGCATSAGSNCPSPQPVRRHSASGRRPRPHSCPDGPDGVGKLRMPADHVHDVGPADLHRRGRDQNELALAQKFVQARAVAVDVRHPAAHQAIVATLVRVGDTDTAEEFRASVAWFSGPGSAFR